MTINLSKLQEGTKDDKKGGTVVQNALTSLCFQDQVGFEVERLQSGGISVNA